MVAIVCHVVGAGILVLASSTAATDGLSLVQTRATLKTGKPTEHVSSGVKDDFAAVDAQVGKLEASVVELQRQHRAAVSDATKEYQGKLTAQVQANRLAEEANSKLVAEIERLEGSNAHLRKEAAALKTEWHALGEDQRALAKNFTIVHEFAADAIETASVDAKSSELDVLDELEEEDHKRHEVSEKQRHLKEIAAQGSKLALLEKPVQDDGGDQDKDPKSLLEGLEGQLIDLKREQGDSLTQLREKFAEKLEVLADSHTKLLAEQKKLEATKASLTELQARLKTAVEYLEKKRDESLEHSRSLRRFAASVGKRPLPEEAAVPHGRSHSGDDATALLLQLDAVQPNSELLAPSRSTVVHTLSSQIHELEERVHHVQMENDEAIAKHKASYELKLKAQQAENHDVASQNVHLSKEIADLEGASSMLEEKAVNIGKTTHRLRDEMLILQENVSMVEEFSNQLLKDVDSSGAPQLEVLRELTEEAKKRESRKAQQDRLGEIAAQRQPQSSLSMLEFTAKTRVRAPAGSNPSELVTSLEGNLDALAAEQADRETTLKREFKDKSVAFSEQLTKLLAKQQALKQRRESLVTLKSRLEAAVAELGGTQERLQAGLTSLRTFMLRTANGSSNAPATASTGKQPELMAQPNARKAVSWASRFATWAGVASGQ